MGQRTIKGQRQFLVRWLGYTVESDTWEQEKELNCPRLIEEFLAEQEEKDAAKEKSSPEKKSKTKPEKNSKKKEKSAKTGKGKATKS